MCSSLTRWRPGQPRDGMCEDHLNVTLCASRFPSNHEPGDRVSSRKNLLTAIPTQLQECESRECRKWTMARIELHVLECEEHERTKRETLPSDPHIYVQSRLGLPLPITLQTHLCILRYTKFASELLASSELKTQTQTKTPK